MIPIGQLKYLCFEQKNQIWKACVANVMATHDDTNFVLGPQITQRSRRPSKWSYQFQRNSLNTKSV